MNDVVEYAQQTRREAALLRAEVHRLTQRMSEIRLAHLQQRQSCEEAFARSQRSHERLPTWPAWTGPTDELWLTLVPLD